MCSVTHDFNLFIEEAECKDNIDNGIEIEGPLEQNQINFSGGD